MENLRAKLESDLKDCLEGEWKAEVELTNPDGETQIYSKNNPTEKLGGQVLYFTRRLDPATGEAVVVNQPCVTLRITSLDRVPASGEKWFIKMPIAPQAGAAKQSFVFTPTRAIEHGIDNGFIRIYPQKIEDINHPGPIS